MTNESSYQNYLGTLQQPAGWFDFAVSIVTMIAQNAQQGEDLDFLCEVGMKVAALNPLPEAKTLIDLTISMNTRLDAFKWGHVDIEDHGNCLILTHSFMPVVNNGYDKVWQKGFVAMLNGLYHEWLKQAGSPSTLTLSLKDITGPTTAVFCLRKNR